MISEREYLKLRAEIESRCRLDIEALDRVWSMAHKGQPAPQKATPVRSPSAIGTIVAKATEQLLVEAEAAALNKRAAVRAAIHALSGEFGSKDVRAALERDNPEASARISENQLSSIIARLADLGEIHVVIERQGRTPASYAHGPKPVEVQAS